MANFETSLAAPASSPCCRAALLAVGLRQEPGRRAGRPRARRRRRRRGDAGHQPQDFVVNVGDRVFFETDSTELTPQSRATLDRQAQWLNQYPRYTFTIEGHADERGTREYNIALGARRAAAVQDYLVVARRRGEPHAHDLLRQGAAGRGLRRHLLLVAEPARGHGDQQRRHLSPARNRRSLRAAACAAAAFAFGAQIWPNWPDLC